MRFLPWEDCALSSKRQSGIPIRDANPWCQSVMVHHEFSTINWWSNHHGLASRIHKRPKFVNIGPYGAVSGLSITNLWQKSKSVRAIRNGLITNFVLWVIPEDFIAFRGFFRHWQSVDCVILFILTARLYRIYIMSKLMKTAEEFLSVRFRESDYGVLAVGLLHHPLLALEKKNASSFIDISLIISDVKKIQSNSILANNVTGKNIYRIQ